MKVRMSCFELRLSAVPGLCGHIFSSGLLQNVLFIMDSKLTEYETFVNEKLRGDLRQVESRLEKILKELNEFQTLNSIIRKLEEKKIPTSHMRVNTDLGCNFHVQAQVFDPCTMYIHLGLDIYVEMPLEQASKYVAARIKGLMNAADALKKTEYQIKSDIRIMLEGIRKMQNIPPEPDQKSSRSW